MAPIDIVGDPPGDIVIRVGPEGSEDRCDIRVHKNTMMMASPVFKAMLGGGFAEASRKLDENDPLVLEDDHPQAFILLCEVLHLREFDALTAFRQLGNITFLADKCAVHQRFLLLSWRP